MTDFFAKLQQLIENRVPCVAVTVVDTVGSVPQDCGAKMIVTAEGRSSGTIGGGKIEARAIEEARNLLSDHSTTKTRFVNWSLNKDIGMTCGGSVKLYFEAFQAKVWNIVLFGAGHVAQALVPLLLPLDCQVTCIDPRVEWLDRLPHSAKLTKIQSGEMTGEVARIPEGSFVALMTMGHTTDKPILLEILRTRTFPYLGVIGSDAKAKRLREDIHEAGLPENLCHAFFCPIGLDFGTNHPHEIALSIVAQLIQERDRRN
ncbi:MAG: xanthine dehydrogenase accessory protein XdhC [Blastocatellia bacterium]|nr:xanthine dehydrogenase accessory protein XdhC [Blastocatellia bacterium]